MNVSAAIPEIPVSTMDVALRYYEQQLGFTIDWGGDGLAGISRGDCRIFLADATFREHHGNQPPVLIWLNLDGRDAVDALHDEWHGRDARIVAAPAEKPWGLYEFTVADPDGNFLRVFYDFATPQREQRD